MKDIVVQALTEEEVKKVFKEEFAKELIEETGWWFSDGRILIIDQKNELENAKVMIHEVVEYIVEMILGLSHKDAHEIANAVEREFEIMIKAKGVVSNEEISCKERKLEY